jgi:hypothetical protein
MKAAVVTDANRIICATHIIENKIIVAYPLKPALLAEISSSEMRMIMKVIRSQ